MAERLAPHIVHVEVPEYQTIRNKTFDPARGDRATPDGEDVIPASKEYLVDPETLSVVVREIPEIRSPYWGVDERVRVLPPTADCPDCGRGLSSRGTDLICPRLPVDTALKDEHDRFCIVACGLTDV